MKSKRKSAQAKIDVPLQKSDDYKSAARPAPDKYAVLAPPMSDTLVQKAAFPVKSSHLALQKQFSATAANNRPYRGLDSLHRVFS